MTSLYLVPIGTIPDPTRSARHKSLVVPSHNIVPCRLQLIPVFLSCFLSFDSNTNLLLLFKVFTFLISSAPHFHVFSIFDPKSTLVLHPPSFLCLILLQFARGSAKF
ncbi:hypothetical protein RJT34_24198 [Clitoria ternatea]|uniref:Uncharacterized protein n=1 Tax=Clitoria ternatea TaxID=43366 RepID=A0AAN9FMF9_CLITE